MPYAYRPDSLWGPAMREASAPNEFYNYMTGAWRDGTPLTAKGLGYNPGNPNLLRTGIAFPGYPDDSEAWTELNTQSPSGNRRALFNFDLGKSPLNWPNSLTLQYAYIPWEEGTLTERIQRWESEHKALRDHLRCCVDFEKQPPPLGCESGSYELPQPEPFTICPNPANEQVRVWHSGIYLRKMLLYDVLGRVVGIGINQGDYSAISTLHLLPGIYYERV